MKQLGTARVLQSLFVSSGHCCRLRFVLHSLWDEHRGALLRVADLNVRAECDLTVAVGRGVTVSSQNVPTAFLANEVQLAALFSQP